VRVPPFGVIESLGVFGCLGTSRRAPASASFLRVVEVGYCVVDGVQVFDLWDFDHRGSEVEHVADGEGELRVFDSQLNGDSHAVCDFAEVCEVFFAEWGVLGIDGEVVVVSLGHRLFDVGFGCPHPY